jgi:uncharacterized protein (DUF1800 family)
MRSARKLSAVLSLSLLGFACAGNPRPQDLRPTAEGPAPLHLPWAAAGLTRREAAAHLLSRFSYGPRPGEVEAVAAMGPERWLERQLAADPAAADPGLADRLAVSPALSMTVAESLCTYPADGAVRTEARKAGVIPDEVSETAADAVPREEREKEIRAILAEYSRRRGYRPQGEILEQLSAQKLLRAVYAESQLGEVMTDFWFNHFNVSWTDDRTRPYLPAFERDAIRPFALGRFRDLLGATARHPAMLLYLDNAQSVAPGGATTTFEDEMAQAGKKPGIPRPQNGKGGINENYARELMELHTLGVDGGYTQADVVEVARAFTGWTVVPADRGTMDRIEKRMQQERSVGGEAFRLQGHFLFRADLHDAGPKMVLGRPLPAGRGIEDGEEVLGLLAAHRETARHLAFELAVRFVADHPSQALVERLSGVYLESGGDIRRTVRAIAESREFWSPAARGAKVKSPLELAASALRALGADVKDPKPTVAWIAKLGEPLYSYQPPTGYPDRAEAWLNAGTLLGRMNFGLRLAAGKLPGVTIDPAALASLAAEAQGGPKVTDQRAPTPAPQTVGMLLGSPEFQRR